jgi:PAS domain S-box-containing protein
VRPFVSATRLPVESVKRDRGVLATRTELDSLRRKLDKTERALESLTRIFSLIPDPIEIVAPDYTILFANRASRLLHDNELLEGTFYYESVMGMEEPPAGSPILNAVDDDRETTYTATDDVGDIYDIAITPIVLSDGRRAAMCYSKPAMTGFEFNENTGDDVLTLKKIAERSSASLDAVLSQITDGVLLLGSGGEPILFNRAFGELTGLTATGQDSAKKIATILFPDHAGNEPATEILAGLAREGETRRFETILSGADGGITPVEMAVSLIPGEPGDEAVQLLSVRDLRETHDMKDKLIKALNLSLAGERIASLAHQVNNYLTPAFYHADKLGQRGDLDRKTRQSVTTIQNYLNLCHESIVMVLSLIRPAVPTEINMNHLISEVFSKHYLAEDLRLDNIEVVQRYDPSMVQTVGYPVLLQQAIANIIKNAQEAMVQEGGGRRLMVFTESTPTKITIRISDNGPGIPKDIKDKIFDLLFTSKSSGKGSGVGLHFSKEVISKHEGTIRVRSREGEGATFVIELPVLSPDDSVGDVLGPAAVKARVPDPASIGGPVVEHQTGRILIIDDEPGILELLSDILVDRNHKVTTCCDANEALGRIQIDDFDCIICDIRMPEIDGFELSQRIKEYDKDLFKRLVFTTGDIFNDKTDAFINETGTPCIEKPFTPAQVHNVVQGVFARNAGPVGDSADSGENL